MMRLLILTASLGVFYIQNAFAFSRWETTALEVREKINQRMMDLAIVSDSAGKYEYVSKR